MIPEDIYLKIVRSAIKAPSGHNTQSWWFMKDNDCIWIMPDFIQSLPITDSDNRELYISQGCAAQNAIISARFYGYSAELDIDVMHEPCSIKIQLKKAEKVEDAELFSSINLRQTTRNLYNDTPIPNEDLLLLKQSAVEQGIDIRFFIGPMRLKNLHLILLKPMQYSSIIPILKMNSYSGLDLVRKRLCKKGMVFTPLAVAYHQ